MPPRGVSQAVSGERRGVVVVRLGRCVVGAVVLQRVGSPGVERVVAVATVVDVSARTAVQAVVAAVAAEVVIARVAALDVVAVAT